MQGLRLTIVLIVRSSLHVRGELNRLKNHVVSGGTLDVYHVQRSPINYHAVADLAFAKFAMVGTPAVADNRGPCRFNIFLATEPCP